MTPLSRNIEGSWSNILKNEFQKDYWKKLEEFIDSEYKTGIIFPEYKNIFRALNSVPFDKVRVVIIGQDPYHGEGEANGLAFSVNNGVKLPPSLKNIYKEIGFITPYPHGDLSAWSNQGVLLLNSVLTVRKDSPASHKDKGWEKFTDEIINILSTNKTGLVFMLWGNYAKAKGIHIGRQKHLVLESPHPSPFSARHGFFGCGHFEKTNENLKRNGQVPIVWTLK